MNQSNKEYIELLLQSGVHTLLKETPNNLLNSKAIDNGINDSLVKKNLQEVQEIQELISLISAHSSPLKKTSKKLVVYDGDIKSNLMIIGEAPGKEEDEQGKPFVGRAGQLLDKMLAAIGLNRKKVYISNIIPWRPPNNRTPTTDEIIQCLPFVQRHIEIVNPKLLILLGSTATKALMVTNLGITKLRGKWHKYNSIGLSKTILTRAIFHPAFLLRSPDYKRVTWDDLKEIQKEITKNEKI